MPRILAIDFGTRRVGAALSDPRGEFASPLEVYERRDDRQDAAHYRRLVEAEDVGRIVVGLPVHLRGGEGESARRAREFGAWLAAETGRPVVFYDERFTTVEAEELMREGGLKGKARRDRIDMMAAQILLREYIEAGCPEHERPVGSLDDPAGGKA